jgi:hypothetical protein
VTLTDTANRGVAAHLPQRLDVVRQQQGFAAHAGAGECSLGASVASADNDDIKFLGVIHTTILIQPLKGVKNGYSQRIYCL